LVGILAATVLSSHPNARDWDPGDSFKVSGASDQEQARISVLGLSVSSGSLVGGGGAKRFTPANAVLMAGPLNVQVREGAESEWKEPLNELYLERDDGWPARVFTTVPGILSIVGLLYAFAYGETLQRGVRRRRGAVRFGDVAGMTGVGAILGLVVVVFGWTLGAFPQWPVVIAATALTGAAAGLWTFAVAARAEESAGSVPATAD
jgi:molecular chaperone DnaK